MKKTNPIIGETFFLLFLFVSSYSPSLTWSGICQIWQIFTPVWIIFGVWELRHLIAKKYQLWTTAKQVKQFWKTPSPGQNSQQNIEGIDGESFQIFWNKTEKITRSTIEKFFGLSKTKAGKIINLCLEKNLLSKGGLNNQITKQTNNITPLFEQKNFFPIYRTPAKPLK